MSSEFESDLAGGHPNSLGNTVLVAERVNADQSLLDDLIQTYSSADDVVRLRVSSALKRVALEHPEWVRERLATIEEWVAHWKQPSAQWSIAEIYRTLSGLLTRDQYENAVAVMKDHLASSTDWIVINQTLETLAQWAQRDDELREWLIPQLWRYSDETRKSIAGRAKRWIGKLDTRGLS